MNVNATVASNTFWNALNTIGALLLGLVTSIVLARTLGPIAIGQYHYWLWITGILVLISSPGLSHAMTRFGAELLGKEDRQTASALFYWFLLLELALAGLVGGLALLYARFGPQVDILALALVAFTVAPGVTERLFLAAVQATQDFRFLAQASLAGNLFYAVAAMTAVSLGYGIYVLLFISIARRIVPIALIGWKLPTYFSLRGARHFSVPPELRRRLLQYCRAVVLLLIIDTILWERSELFFLKRFADDAEIAFYSQPFEIALKAMAIPAIFSGVLLPTFSFLAGNKDRSAFYRLHHSSYRVLALVAMPIGLGGAAVAPLIAKLYGIEFLPMTPVLSILLVGNIVGALSNFSFTILHSVERLNFVVRLSLLIALVNIALDLLLIPTYGAVGAAIANSASKVVSGVVAIAYSVRLLNLSFPLGSVTRIGLAALASSAAAWLIGAFVGSLVLAIFAAILSYPFMLRLFAALDAGDYDLLNGLTPNLPTNLVPAYQGLLRILIP